MKLYFGDEQFEVDAAQLPIAFTQVTLMEGEETREQKRADKLPPLSPRIPMGSVGDPS